MRLVFRKKASSRLKSRTKNKVRVRKKVSGTSERPRLAIYRSGLHMYAQVIDDVKGQTIASSSTLKSVDKSKSSVSAALSLGKEIGKILKEKKINKVVFDRSGYIYHGRVKAVAEGARESGLEF